MYITLKEMGVRETLNLRDNIDADWDGGGEEYPGKQQWR